MSQVLAPLRIGTSGWSYPDGRGTWNGLFYPRRGVGSFKPGDELAYYAEHFNTVEVNVTFYRQPTASMTARWVRETPPGFEFSVKLNQAFSHAVPVGRGLPAPTAPGSASSSLPTPGERDVAAFLSGIDPIAAAGKLGSLLLQFPPSFRRDAASTDYLGSVLRTFSSLPVAVELRHRSWSDAERETMALLDEHRSAWVQIDEPKFRFSIRQDLVPNTERFYYLRLHGRNAADWWKPKAPEDRYNYLYSQDELQVFADVVKTVRPAVKKLYLYLNNHFASKAVVNATVLEHQLGEPVRGDYSPELVEAYPDLRAIIPAMRRNLFD